MSRNEKYRACTLCPRKCNIDRTINNGFCHEKSTLHVSRASLHMWEEPCISGKNGSGTVFFSGCNMRCVFCQNQEISRGEVGKYIDTERLVEIFFELKDKGANNVNLVTGDIFIPTIADAIEKAKDRGFQLPFLLNTSSYISVESLKMLEGLIDIYLPDMKYIRNEDAVRYSSAPGYVEAAKAAIEEMVRQQPKCEFMKEREFSPECESVPECEFSPECESMPECKNLPEGCSENSGLKVAADADERIDKTLVREDDGPAEPTGSVLRRGVVVRHLLMPGMLIQAKMIVKYLYEKYGDSIYISLMNQYTPDEERLRDKYPEISRRVKEYEYKSLVDYAAELGVSKGFMQVGETAEESFIPAFDLSGV